MTNNLKLRAAAGLCTFFLCSVAHAGPIVLPPVLNAGDQYRLAFVTSTTRDATTTNIADYNQFVTDIANSVPELAALNTNWYVLGETPGVTLSQNTGFASTPTFRLDGRWIASSIVNFYIGPLSSLIAVDEHGDIRQGVDVWTGLGPGKLGDLAVTFGNSATFPTRWGLAGGLADNTSFKSLYAISGVLTATPEPSTTALMITAGAALCTLRRRKRWYATSSRRG